MKLTESTKDSIVNCLGATLSSGKLKINNEQMRKLNEINCFQFSLMNHSFYWQENINYSEYCRLIETFIKIHCNPIINLHSINLKFRLITETLNII